MKIVSGGQSGVDRAALDVAIERGMPYAGWCPRGSWAEDLPDPPGLLALYPLLAETPLADPAQRTAWNVRDSNAVLIVLDDAAVSPGTDLARELSLRCGKPTLVVALNQPDAVARAAAWLAAQPDCGMLGVGGPRESESPGIYRRTKAFLRGLWPADADGGRSG
jgi:hypothetical protein